VTHYNLLNTCEESKSENHDSSTPQNKAELLSLTNNYNATIRMLTYQLEKFQKMYEKRAFMQWVTSCKYKSCNHLHVDLGEIDSLIRDYQEIMD